MAILPRLSQVTAHTTNRQRVIFYLFAGKKPHGDDRFEFWHAKCHRRRDHPRQILYQPLWEFGNLIFPVLTTRRNARIASAVLAIAIPSVCLSVCPSVTSRYYVKTTARSTVQFAVSDSNMCLVF